jgi:hypothetical protein
MTRDAMNIADLTTRTGNGLGGLGCSIIGGLGTTTMTITTTSWTRGAAGVR